MNIDAKLKPCQRRTTCRRARGSPEGEGEDYMKHTFWLSTSVLALVCCAAAHAQTTTTTSGSSSTNASGGGVEQVVVTAQRRKTELQKTDLSATVLTGKELAQK